MYAFPIPPLRLFRATRYDGTTILLYARCRLDAWMAMFDAMEIEELDL